VLAFAAITNQFSVVGLAAAPGVITVGHESPRAAVACSQQVDAFIPCKLLPNDDLLANVPSGAKPCPASGAGAACGDGSAKATPGKATTPGGQTACPQSSSTIPAVAACTDTALPSDNPAGQNIAVRLDLSTSSPSPSPGDNIVLVATASKPVTGTGNQIEIFDRTTGTLVGACAQGSQCMVAYAAKAGTHTFQAYITAPVQQVPRNGTSFATSNPLTAVWMSVSLTASQVATAPGKPVTLTATSTVAFEKSGYVLELFDVGSNQRLTYCSQGTTCSITLTQPGGGTRNVIADLAKPSATFPPPEAQAQSQLLPVSWLAVSVQGTTSGRVGSVVYLTAAANADLANTPWSIGIFDDQGHLVAPPCKSSTCTVQVTLPAGPTPHYTAEIGAVPPSKVTGRLGQLWQAVTAPSALVDIQARSAAVLPVRLLWGVDSCKAFTSDPNGSSGIYQQVVSGLGTPDFWGRYLTNTICPGISWAEISTAYKNHMGILPIFNDYNCSNVSGYATGQSYAESAIAAARYLHIPQGVGLAIDIEPPGEACPGAVNVDFAFIQGWHDHITAAHYVPIYYGNGTSGSEFANAWCIAATVQPSVLSGYVWSFEPSLLGNFNRATSPAFSPNQTGCGGWAGAWQYQLGSNSSNQDVDHDLAVTTLPLWFPTPW